MGLGVGGGGSGWTGLSLRGPGISSGYFHRGQKETGTKRTS